jgi:hypothetical protein
MADGGKMHADLVSAASVQLDFGECGGTDAGEDAPVRAGFASFGENEAATGGHAEAIFGIAADGGVNAAARFRENAFDERDVNFFYGAEAEGVAEFGVGGVIFGDEDYAGSVFVEAMNDAGAERVATLRERLTAAEQRVDESAAKISGSGVDDHSGGFVDGDDVIVFVEDVERDGFGFGEDGRALGSVDGDEFAAMKAMCAFGGATIYEDEAGVD